MGARPHPISVNLKDMHIIMASSYGTVPTPATFRSTCPTPQECELAIAVVVRGSAKTRLLQTTNSFCFLSFPARSKLVFKKLIGIGYSKSYSEENKVVNSQAPLHMLLTPNWSPKKGATAALLRELRFVAGMPPYTHCP